MAKKSAADALKEAFNDFVDELMASLEAEEPDDDDVEDDDDDSEEEEEVKVYTSKQLDKLDKAELLVIAKALGLDVSRKRENTLRTMILDAQSASDDDDDDDDEDWDDEDTDSDSDDDDDDDDDEEDEWDEDEDEDDDEEEEEEKPRKAKGKKASKTIVKSTKKAAKGKSKKK